MRTQSFIKVKDVKWTPSMKGEDIKRRREALGLTQVEFAHAIHVTPNTVARWERDEVQYPGMLEIVLDTFEGVFKP
jgi:DNA-binding transcriptional regulator YiaG